MLSLLAPDIPTEHPGSSQGVGTWHQTFPEALSTPVLSISAQGTRTGYQASQALSSSVLSTATKMNTAAPVLDIHPGHGHPSTEHPGPWNLVLSIPTGHPGTKHSSTNHPSTEHPVPSPLAWVSWYQGYPWLNHQASHCWVPPLCNPGRGHKHLSTAQQHRVPCGCWPRVPWYSVGRWHGQCTGCGGAVVPTVPSAPRLQLHLPLPLPGPRAAGLQRPPRHWG